MWLKSIDDKLKNHTSHQRHIIIQVTHRHGSTFYQIKLLSFHQKKLSQYASPIFVPPPPQFTLSSDKQSQQVSLSSGQIQITIITYQFHVEMNEIQPYVLRFVGFFYFYQLKWPDDNKITNHSNAKSHEGNNQLTKL